MRIYSNEQAVQIEKLGFNFYNDSKIIDLSKESFEIDILIPHTVFLNATVKHIVKVLIFLEKNKLKNASQILFLVNNLKETRLALKDEFLYIKAAGGLVENKAGQYLFIKRLGKWDLPKGKAEKEETDENTAVREVEEECGVKVKIGKKITNTWHVYETKKGFVLKRTKWFEMILLSDKNMSPQIEEGIEEIAWKKSEDFFEIFKNTYNTIKEVFVSKGLHF